MDGDLTKTPYNSIYETLKKTKQQEELVCCVHGTNCVYGRGGKEGAGVQKAEVKPDENQYVNLPSPRKEREVAEKLTARLNRLANEQPQPQPQQAEKPEMMSLNSLIVNNLGADIRKMKASKDRKKKKAPALIDDNQSYVMLGPSSEEATSQTVTQSVSTSQPTETYTIAQPDMRLGEASSAYLGVSTLANAENRVPRRGEFALYHLFHPKGQLDTLAEGLPLMLVYRTTTKKNRHYPVRVTSDQHFFVDCGYPNVRKHFSLNQLVMYYKTSATCEINPDDASADSFCWWLE